MNRLYLRLFIWFVAANAATLIITIIVTQSIAQGIFEHGRPDWRSLANDTVHLYQQGPRKALHLRLKNLHRRGIEVQLLAPDGHRLIGRPIPRPLTRHLTELRGSPDIILSPRPDLTLASIEVGQPPDAIRFIAVRHPPPPRGFMWLPLAVELVVSLLVISILGWFTARGIVRPLAQVQTAARRVAEGELNARVGAPLTATQGELGQLARDFDLMASRIESLIERTRGLLRDVSHELRSPLARLQLSLEMARNADDHERQAHLDYAQREVERVDQLIEEVLALARMEARLPERMDVAVDLSALLKERCSAAALEATARGLRLTPIATPALAVIGQRELLARMIDNLISNAIKFSPKGGEVIARLFAEADVVTLTIEDQGPGVPIDEIDQLFEPFFRGGNANLAAGHGLGLAIVRRVVQAHGGNIKASNRGQGGLKISVVLPADRERSAISGVSGA